MDKIKLLFATTNRNKVKEISALVLDAPITFISLNDIASIPPVEENGVTFSENALKKASFAAKHTKMIAVSDDSGLVIPFLNNEPGIHSSRFGGEDLPYDRKMAIILDRMKSAEPNERHAYFACAIACVAPNGKTITTEAKCHGTIALAPSGKLGFGYDPIFIPNDYNETMAELPIEMKNAISHRGQAFRKLIEQLPDFLKQKT